MRRREFISLLGGATLAWPLAARAQQSGQVRRVGVLMASAQSDPEAQARVRALEAGLRELGFSDAFRALHGNGRMQRRRAGGR